MPIYLNRTRVLLNKAQKMYDFIDHTDDLSATERDLMLAYLRDLYDAFLEDTRFVINKETTPEPPKSTPKIVEKVVEKVAAKIEEQAAAPIAVPPVFVPEIPKTVVPETVISEVQHTAPSVIFETEVVATEPLIIAQSVAVEAVLPPKTEPIPEPKVSLTPPKRNVPTMRYDEDEEPNATENDLEELFRPKSREEGGASRPITNLRAAFGINERMFSINELFGGSAGQFDLVLDTINNSPDFAAAKAYLVEHIVPTYGWLQANKIKKAQGFVQKVQARFS